MNTIQDFLAGNVEALENKEVHLSRFRSPFIIKAISQNENSALEKRAKKTYRSKSGQLVTDFDNEKYIETLVTECIVQPNLGDAQLQASYGTDGDRNETLKAMLTSGEYVELSKAVIELNGYDEDLGEVVEEVKN